MNFTLLIVVRRRPFIPGSPAGFSLAPTSALEKGATNLSVGHKGGGCDDAKTMTSVVIIVELKKRRDGTET